MKTYTHHGNQMFCFKYRQTTIQIEHTESDPADWVFDSYLYLSDLWSIKARSKMAAVDIFHTIHKVV